MNKNRISPHSVTPSNEFWKYNGNHYYLLPLLSSPSIKANRVLTIDECICSCRELRTGARPSISSKNIILGLIEYAWFRRFGKWRAKNAQIWWSLIIYINYKAWKRTGCIKWRSVKYHNMSDHLIEEKSKLPFTFSHPLAKTICSFPHKEGYLLTVLTTLICQRSCYLLYHKVSYLNS